MFKRFIAIGILVGFIPLPAMMAVVSYEKPTVEYTQIVEEESTTYVAEIIEPSPEEVTTIISGAPIEQETTTEEVTTEVETEVETTVVPDKPAVKYTDEDVELLALIMLAEAEDQTELGRRLVVDVILNRVDSERHPNTIYDVVYQKNQFSVTTNGRLNRVTVTDEARALVREELESRTNYDVIYFRMHHYHGFGTPLFQEDEHYFSGY